MLFSFLSWDQFPTLHTLCFQCSEMPLRISLTWWFLPALLSLGYLHPFFFFFTNILLIYINNYFLKLQLHYDSNFSVFIPFHLFAGFLFIVQFPHSIIHFFPFIFISWRQLSIYIMAYGFSQPVVETQLNVLLPLCELNNRYAGTNHHRL